MIYVSCISSETVVLKIEDYDSMEALCLGSAPLESCERCDVKRKCTDYEPYWAEEARLTDPTTRYSLPFKVGVAYWKDESYRDESGLATVVQTGFLNRSIFKVFLKALSCFI